MSSSTSNAGTSAGDAVKKGVGLVHGLGEAIRGNVNAAADSATGDRTGAAKHEAIASHGAEEIDHGYHHQRGTGAGVTPVDTDRQRVTGGVPGEYTTTTTGNTNLDIRKAQTDGSGDQSTNYGPHRTNMGNKADPRYDSDLDHRGPRDHASNYGPHSSNIGNKLDPGFDSDRDHRAAKASTNYGPHRTKIANKLDPRYDSDLDHRGTEEGSTSYGFHSTNLGNKPDARYDSDLDDRGAGASSNYGPYRIHDGKKLDPRYQSDLDSRRRRSTWGPETQQGYSYGDDDQREDGDIGTANFEHASRELMGASIRSHPEGIPNPGESSYQRHEGDRYENCYGPYQEPLRAPYYNNPPYPCYDDPRYSPPVRRRDSEPMPYFTNAYEDIESRPPKYAPLPYLPLRDPQQHRPPQTYEVHDRLELEANKHPPHSYRVANILDPRTSARSPVGDPHSTEYPHKSGMLNLLDPRVNARTVRKERKSQEKSAS